MIITRCASQSDIAEMQELFRSTILSIPSKIYNPKQKAVWSDATKNKERWVRLITKQHCLLAEENNRIVGFISLENHDYLDFLYVHKHHFRKGVAQTLYNQIELCAREFNSKSLTSDVSIVARPFFEKNGFGVIEKQANKVQDQILINYKMHKKL